MPKKMPTLPDPTGMIARIKSRLPPNCGTRKSPYCEVIISMRMQGIHYQKISEWLVEQGPQYKLDGSTICKHLKATGLTVELSRAEELAEKWGGRIDLDLARELQGQIILQRDRVDKLQRLEEERRQTNKSYFDRRLRQERELLVSMIKDLNNLMKTPLEDVLEGKLAGTLPLEMTVGEDALSIIREMILSGELRLAPKDEDSVYN